MITFEVSKCNEEKKIGLYNELFFTFFLMKIVIMEITHFNTKKVSTYQNLQSIISYHTTALFKNQKWEDVNEGSV